MISKDLISEEYIEDLVLRISAFSCSIPELNNGITKQYENIYKNNLKAFRILMNNLTEENIILAGNMVNDDSKYISKGYRKIGNHISDTEVKTSDPVDISYNVRQLLKKYHTDWQEISPYEREAKFMIEFIHIHPFEDGNGRVARLILATNLIKNNLNPIALSPTSIKDYCACLNTSNVNELTTIFNKLVENEKNYLNEFNNVEKISISR